MGDVNDKPVIAVTGTLREGDLVKGLGVTVVAGGSDPERLRAQLAEMAPHAAGIISFGMAGAIDRHMKLGDMIIGSRLIGGFTGDCDEGWVKALRTMIPTAKVGAMHADGRFFADHRSKNERAGRSAALAVDMESHLAAQAAADAGIPFAILRSISDLSEVNLPPAIALAMKPDGGVNYGAVIGSILKQPGQLPNLMTTVSGFAKAYGQFGRALKKVQGRLGFDLR